MDISEALSAAVPELKNLKEPQTMQELLEQLAIISKAIEKTEKMMQYLALSMSGGDELQTYSADYRQLLAEKERLSHKKI